ncbi:MAG: hypothetical protein QOI10_4666 [Solirubrobacterales bacterium]|nr:hypothetical protein [Solirubrobacterales bacterium]
MSDRLSPSSPDGPTMVDGGAAGEADPGEKPTREAAGTVGDGPIEVLASAWLEAERQAIAVGNANNTEERARQASAAYDAAVSAATPEDLLLAWRASEATAAEAEMGSKAWAEAREVAELLRVEYLAARS